jgi:hypothetical protein
MANHIEKFKHAVTGSSTWMIFTPYPSEPRNASRRRTVYQSSKLGFYCHASGMIALLEPHYDSRYQGGTIPLWFTATGFTNKAEKGVKNG